MAKKVRVKDLQSGTNVKAIFHIRALERSKKRNGADFFRLTLGDSTGELNAVAWDNIEQFLNNQIKRDDFVLVEGTVGTYQDSLQLTVTSAKPVDSSSVDLMDFVASTPFDIENLKKELWDLVKQIEDEDLQRLTHFFFDDEAFFDEFCKAPSAKTMHQAYIGGLLEHTVGVCKNAVAISNNYDGCNMSLLLAGCLLHDIGKIKEFSITTGIDYTDDGRLRGHIIIGLQMLEEAISALNDFPEQKKILLEHLLISHHGMKEWGSPRRPKTMEALILHFADYIDAYMSTYIEVVKKCKEQGYRWSEWNRMFERYLFAGFEEPIDASLPKKEGGTPTTDSLES